MNTSAGPMRGRGCLPDAGRRAADSTPCPSAVRRPDAQLAVVREANRLRALLERTADAIDLALDSDWRVAVDILLDLSDEIHAEFLP